MMTFAEFKLRVLYGAQGVVFFLVCYHIKDIINGV